MKSFGQRGSSKHFTLTHIVHAWPLPASDQKNPCSFVNVLSQVQRSYEFRYLHLWPSGALIVRSMLLAIGCLVVGVAFAEPSQSLQKPSLRTTDKAKLANKAETQGDKAQAVSIELPASIAVVVSGRVNVEGSNDQAIAHHEPIKWSEWLVALFTGFLVAVTGWLVYYTRGLWTATVNLSRDADATSKRQAREMADSLSVANRSAEAAEKSAEAARRTVEAMEKTAMQQLRAYVSCQPNYISNFSAQTRVSIKSGIRNHGQTPAYDEYTDFVGIKLWPYPLPPNWNFPPERSGHVAKNDIFQDNPLILNAVADSPFTDDEIKEIRSGARRIYVYGVLKYRDAFGSDRETQFCRCIVPDAGLMAVLDGQKVENGGISFEVTDQHNKST